MPRTLAPSSAQWPQESASVEAEALFVKQIGPNEFILSTEPTEGVRLFPLDEDNVVIQIDEEMSLWEGAGWDGLWD